MSLPFSNSADALPDRREAWLGSALLVALVLLVFGRSLGYGFLAGWDDDIYVTANWDRLQPSLSNARHWLTAFHAGNYHPLTMLSLMLDTAVWGDRAWGFRLHSLLWHGVTCICLWRVLLHLGVERVSSWWLAACFAVHPQRVESVVWVAERKDVLCAALYFAAVLIYLRRCTKPDGRAGVLPLVLFTAALLAKAMAISLPVLLLLYELRESGRTQWRRAIRRLWPLLLTAAIFVPLTVWAQGDAVQPAIGLGRRLLVVWHNLLWYAHTLPAPVGLSPLYARLPISPRLVFSLVLQTVGAGVLLVCLAWRNGRDAWLWPLAYGAALAPVSGLVPLGAIDYADRYSYIPGAVLLGGIGVLLRIKAGNRWPTWKTHVGGTAAVLLFSGLTWGYQDTFADLHHLLERAVSRPRPNAVAIGALADRELQQRRFARALELADMLDTRAAATDLGDVYAVAYRLKAQYLRGAVAYRLGQWQSALTTFTALSSRFPPGRDATMFRLDVMLSMQADACARLGDSTRALHLYDQLLQRYPRHAEAYLNRGVIHFRAGRFAAAATDFEAAWRRRPNDPLARHNLVQALMRAGRTEEAERRRREFGLAPLE